VNSLRSVERAVRSEIERQAGILDAGGRIVQETRHFHEESGTTTSGRSKEEAQDYRYFPEPDLIPIAPSPEWISQIRAGVPDDWRTELTRGSVQAQAAWRAAGADVSDSQLDALRNAGVFDLVERTVKAVGAAVPVPVAVAAACKWWLGELLRKANEDGIEPAELGLTPGDVARVIELESSGELNDKLARQVLDGMLAGEGSPDDVVAARGLAVVTDSGVLTAAVDAAIAANPDVAAKIRGGKTAAAGALVGVVMKATRGQADAAVVRDLILARCAADGQSADGQSAR
jgi:aspartyl-tRNA(Asn)/glutamyl-tRNA(Gln) amidotransferase subunit B